MIHNFCSNCGAELEYKEAEICPKCGASVKPLLIKKQNGNEGTKIVQYLIIGFLLFIGFIIIAAVFSYIVLGAGFFTTQKSQETVYQTEYSQLPTVTMVKLQHIINVPSGYKKFNDNLGYSIYLPPQWHESARDVSSDIKLITYTSDDKSLSKFVMVEYVDLKDNIGEKIILNQEFSNAYMKGLRSSLEKEDIRNIVITKDERTYGYTGIDAWEINFQATNSFNKDLLSKIILIDGGEGKMYVPVYMALKEDYSSSEMDTILKSFEIV